MWVVFRNGGFYCLENTEAEAKQTCCTAGENGGDIGMAFVDSLQAFKAALLTEAERYLVQWTTAIDDRQQELYGSRLTV